MSKGMISKPGSTVDLSPVLSFASLEKGLVASLTIMVCRRWDCTSVNNRYLSTDYIFSDIMGTPIHATARSNIAHNFVDKLKDGEVYVLKNFNLMSNKKEYRVLKDSPHMIELTGATIVRKAGIQHEGFQRYPFDFVDFGDLVVTGSKYFVDVIGYVLHVSNPLSKANGKQTVEFELRNERGQRIGTTLWGSLGEDLIARKKKKAGVYVVILTSMTVKRYEARLSLSSSTSTIIVDSLYVPQLQTFANAIKGRNLLIEDEPFGEEARDVDTLYQFLTLARQDKTQAVSFNKPLEVVDVRTKNSWFIYVCNSGRCRRAIVRKNGSFWCESCDKAVIFPGVRYRIQLDVKDDTAQTVIVLFDEAGDKLMQRNAKSLLEEHEQDELKEDAVLPRQLQALIGTSHVFQLRMQSFYTYGDFESFTCIDVMLPSDDINMSLSAPEQSVSAMKSVDVLTSTGCQSKANKLKKVLTIETPPKEKEKSVQSGNVDFDDEEENADIINKLDVDGSGVSPELPGDSVFKSMNLRKRSLYKTSDTVKENESSFGDFDNMISGELCSKDELNLEEVEDEDLDSEDDAVDVQEDGDTGAVKKRRSLKTVEDDDE